LSIKEIARLDLGLIIDFISYVTGVDNVKTIKPLVSDELKDPWIDNAE